MQVKKAIRLPVKQQTPNQKCRIISQKIQPKDSFTITRVPDKFKSKGQKNTAHRIFCLYAVLVLL